MALSADLRALDSYLVQQNRARVERLRGPDPAPVPVAGAWRVTWRFKGCRIGDTFTDKFDSPQALVRGMAKRFGGGDNFVIARVFEMQP